MGARIRNQEIRLDERGAPTNKALSEPDFRLSSDNWTRVWESKLPAISVSPDSCPSSWPAGTSLGTHGTSLGDTQHSRGTSLGTHNIPGSLGTHTFPGPWGHTTFRGTSQRSLGTHNQGTPSLDTVLVLGDTQSKRPPPETWHRFVCVPECYLASLALNLFLVKVGDFAVNHRKPVAH